MGESVSLSWPLHSRTLIEGLWNFLNDGYKTDFEICTNDSLSCRVHQLILAIFCPALLNESKNSRLKVMLESEGLQQEDLQAIVKFIYCGKVTVVEERVDRMLDAALSLGLNSLIEVISHYKIRKSSRDMARSRSSRSAKISSRMLSTKRKSRRLAKKKPSVANNNNKQSGILGGDAAKDSFEEMDVTEDANTCNDETDKSEEQETKTVAEKLKCKRADVSSSEGFKGVCTRGKYRRKAVTGGVDFDPVRNQHVCEYCDKGFASRDRYARHMRCHQNPEHLHCCSKCDYKTGERYTLVQHMASRHRLDADGNPLSRDLKCPHCEFSCVSNFQLRNHAFHKHSTKTFKCAECDYSCVKKADHDKHVRAKHRNERPYLCDLCGYRGKTLSAFKCHMRTHTGERPFICDVCGQSFSLSGTLRCHQKVHGNEEKPHPCHLCSFSTWKRYNLKVHLKHVHKDLFSDDAMCDQVTAEWRDMKGHHRMGIDGQEEDSAQTDSLQRLNDFEHGRHCADDLQFLV